MFVIFRYCSVLKYKQSIIMPNFLDKYNENVVQTTNLRDDDVGNTLLQDDVDEGGHIAHIHLPVSVNVGTFLIHGCNS